MNIDDKKEKLIPELRFKEFKEEWKLNTLSNLTKIYDGTHMTPHYVERGVPFFSVEHLTSDNFNNTKYITQEVYDKESKRTKIEKEDILMTRIGDVGTSKYINWDAKASFYVSLALIKSNPQFNSSFFSQYIRFWKFQKQLYKKTLHVAFPKKINLEDIGTCTANLPTLPEQQKISSFLSLIDKKIELLNKKKELLEIYKKGIMHSIFNRDIRFKDSNGNNYPEWEEKRLGEIGKFYRGHTYSANNVDPKGSLLVLRSSNIQDNKLDIYNNLQFVNKNCDPNILLKVGDLAICMSNGTKELVGKTGEYLGDYKNKLTVGAFCSIFRSNYKFSKYLFQTTKYKKYLYLMLAGTNINNLNNTEMGKLTFFVPRDPAESEKINRFLSSIFHAYDKNLLEIKNTIRFKQSLLQKMFI